ncbi:DUF4376 domain-containing protein [Rhizobium tropici]|uniref:DUF4376 domain-containing protein n=1 Tax=Rhizobium tropici TaxID=398 RepID=A0A329YDT9_RHITR|nr:DUF4376 domain-containing protein [Rhizobium tropici]RAX42389.1 hypothetical protein DQ393_05985 [Rhizobium tropici]
MTQTFARVADGLVIEVVTLPDGVDIAESYHVDLAETFFSCDATVQQGYAYDGKKFTSPVAPEITMADLVAYAAAKRFAVETGGIFVGGFSISTDRASQSLIIGAYNYVQANPDVTVKFKTAAGFVNLTAAQIMTVANAVGAHVQAAFAAESEIIAKISDGTINAPADIDAASWPANS